MSLPNIITLSRIPLMFVIVWLMYQGWLGAASLAFWLFIAAALRLPAIPAVALGARQGRVIR